MSESQHQVRLALHRSFLFNQGGESAPSDTTERGQFFVADPGFFADAFAPERNGKRIQTRSH